MTVPALAKSGLCAILLVFFSVASFAEPGYMWETTVEVSAMGMTMPPQTMQNCQPKQWREPPAQEKDRDNDCKVLDFKQSGSKMSWKMKCEGKHPVTGTGEITFQGETRYSGVVRMSMAEGDSVMKMSGKRLTACDYTGKPPAAAAMADPSGKMLAQQCKQSVDKLDSAVFLRSDMCNSHKQAFCDRLSSIDAVEQAARKGGSVDELAAMCGKSTAGWCSQAATTERLDFVSRNCPAQKNELVAKHCEGRDYTALMGSPYAAFCGEYISKAERQPPQGSVQEVAPLDAATSPAPAPAPASGDPAAKALEAIGEGAKKLKGLFRF